MSGKSSASEEVVIKEYPNTTEWLDENQVKAVGNLILTNRRLVFLRRAVLSEKQIEDAQKLSREATAEQLIQFALTLHKKNLQVPLSSIVSARIGFQLMFQLIFPSPKPYLRVSYKTGSRNIKTERFRFRLPLLKRMLMSEFPTLGWTRAINKAVKAQRRAAR